MALESMLFAYRNLRSVWLLTPTVFREDNVNSIQELRLFTDTKLDTKNKKPQYKLGFFV